MDVIRDMHIFSMILLGYGVKIRYIQWSKCDDGSIKDFSIYKMWNKYTDPCVYIHIYDVDIGFILKLNRG